MECFLPTLLTKRSFKGYLSKAAKAGSAAFELNKDGLLDSCTECAFDRNCNFWFSKLSHTLSNIIIYRRPSLNAIDWLTIYAPFIVIIIVIVLFLCEDNGPVLEETIVFCVLWFVIYVIDRFRYFALRCVRHFNDHHNQNDNHNRNHKSNKQNDENTGSSYGCLICGDHYKTTCLCKNGHSACWDCFDSYVQSASEAGKETSDTPQHNVSFW